jgi:hypothetical protein
MKIFRLGPSLTLLASLSSPAFAQPASSDPNDRAVRAILDDGVGGIDIAPDRRADLTRCDGTSAQGVLLAIQTCWPVLETYRAYSPLIAAMNAWTRLPQGQQIIETPESRTVIEAADRVIANASARTYPAQDVPLMIALVSRSMLAKAQGDVDGVIAHLTTARGILDSSRIEAAGFTGGGDDLDRQIAEARVAKERKPSN